MAYSDELKKQMEAQVEQLNCFLKSAYAGMAHDIKIVWRYGGGPDAIGRVTEQSVADHWRDQYGKHEEVTVGVGDSYYGSTTLSHMLYESAYHMRERLLDKLSEIKVGKTRAELKREAEDAEVRQKELADFRRLQAKYGTDAACQTTT